MARKPRVYYPGALYHVIVRGNGRQIIFRDDEDYQVYSELLREYKERFKFTLYAYVLMTNHAHLLIEVHEVPLSRIMQNLQFRYTRKFNIKYKKEGHLFQGRYKALLCDRDAYFLELSAYIHLNPIRAGIVEKPSEYRWSSYRSIMDEKEVSIVDRDFVLLQFSSKKKAARKAYRRFLDSHKYDGHREELYRVKDQRFLGDDEFIEEIRKNLKEKDIKVYDIPIEKITDEVSRLLGIERTLFYSQRRERRGSLGRAVVGFVGRKLCGYKNSAIADHFNREPATLSEGIRKVENRLRCDEVFSKLVTHLEKSLTGEK
jgi:REP element-mobilizing transposase RayT